jgi:RNA polymerase sigma factor (sigma-70 family)
VKALKKEDWVFRENEELEKLLLPVASYESILIEQQTDENLKIRLRQAIEELTPRQKQIVSMKYFDELTYDDIAEKTGLQKDTLYKVLHEAVNRLKVLLGS